jgi:DMSO/TMAO reductase YedYZ molybdopterin-dependent catalytic subunit
VKRKLFLASSLASVGLAGCTTSVKDALTNGPLRPVLLGASGVDLAVIGTHGLAREYPESAITTDFPLDSLDTPSDPTYTSLQRAGFAPYRLVVDGLVAHPQRLSLAELGALGTLTQITRHDCVEGWSAIGKWTGVQLATVLALAKPAQHARFVVFHCFDRDQLGNAYYESLNLVQAMHPQTFLVTRLNGAPLRPDHGAPVRLKIPLQLGYKSAKWVQRVELVAALPGAGGYWEDQGYAWYAGI